MQFQFTFKHLKVSQDNINHAQEKLEQKIQRYVTKPVSVVVSSHSENRQVKTHICLSAGDGFHAQVEATAEDFTTCVDQLVHKLDGQLKKHKEKLKNHKNHSSVRTLVPKERTTIPDSNWDDLSIDADDLIKYEKARKLRSAS